MAKKKLPAPAPTADTFDGEAAAAASAAATAASAADMAVVNASQILMDVGRLQGLDVARQITTVVLAQVFVRVKNSNEFKDLPYKDADGVLRRVVNLNEFCEHFLGKSASRMYELAANLHVLGPDLYEQAERIGFRATDYRALKALPAPDQDAVKEALESGDKGQVLSVLEQLASVNAALRAQHDDDAKKLAAKDRLLAKGDDRYNKLAEQVELREAASLPEAEAHQLNDLRDAYLAFETAMLRLVKEVDEVLTSPASDPAELNARQTIDYAVRRMSIACVERGIEVDFSLVEQPEFVQELNLYGPGSRAIDPK